MRKIEIQQKDKKKLDNFGPYTSGVGAFIGLWIGQIFPLYGIEVPPGGLVWCMVFAYVFCTCTHRRHYIFSYGAFGGAIGALVGFFVVGALLIPLFFVIGSPHSVKDPLVWWGPVSLHAFGTGIFTLLFSRYMCKKIQRKEKTSTKVERV